MKNTHFRSAQSLLFPGSVVTFRILILALLATLSATQASAAEPIVWDFSTETVIDFKTENNPYTFTASDGKTTMIYTAGSSDGIATQSSTTYLKQNGKSSGTSRTFELKVTGKGVIRIETYSTNGQGKWNVTDGQDGTRLLTDYQGNSISEEIVVANSLYFFTTSKGYICKITWTPSSSAPTPQPVYADYTFHMGVDGQSADTWTITNFTKVEDSADEWQLTEFIFPQSSKNLSFYVGEKGEFIDNHSATKLTSIIQFAALQGKGNNYYPGDGAIGTLRIYGNSPYENYYIGFLPTYMITWGIEGSASPWETAEFAHKDNTTYETTELVTLPDDFATLTYKYYVGPRMENGNVFWIANKSSTDKMTDVNGIKQSGNNPSYASFNGAKGKFRIYDDSGDLNWFCHFVPYYNYILYNEDGTTFYSSDYISSEAQDKDTSFPTDTPTKEGFECIGWSRTQNATTTEMTAGESYTYGTANDKFYPVWEKTVQAPAVCGTITTTGGYQQTLSNGLILYQIDNKGNTKTSGSSQFKEQNIAPSTKGNVLRDKRLAIKANASIKTLIIHGYDNNTNDCLITNVYTKSLTDTEYTDRKNNGTADIKTTGKPNYEYTITFKESVSANTRIWIELNGNLNTYEVCYVEGKSCTAPIVTLKEGDAELQDGYTRNLCPNEHWSGWTATATFDVLPDDETCTLQWYDENNSPVGDAVTTEIGSTETTLTCTYQPTTAGTYYAQVIVSSTDTEKSSSTAQATATLELLSAPAAPTIRADRTEVEQDGSVTLTATGIDESKVSIHWMLSNQSTPEGATYTLIEEDAATATPYEWHVPADAKAGDIYYLCCEVDGQCGSVYSDIIPITVKERVETTCKDIASATITAEKNNMIASIGGIAVSKGQSEGNYMKLGSDKDSITITAAPQYAPFKAGDILYVTCYNKSSSAKTGFKIGNNSTSKSIEGNTETTIQYELNLNDINDGTIVLKRGASEVSYKSIRVERCGLLPFPELAYDNKNIEKQFSTPEIPQPLNNPHSVSPITYTSSNTDVATVDGEGKITYIAIGTTTITAAFTGNEKYSEETASYTLTVNAPAGAEFTAALSTNTETITCEDATLTITTDNATDAEYTWYRREADIKTPIEGTKDNTYATSQAGEFIALVSANGYAQWTNAVTITKNSTVTGATITRLTPFHHYRKGCDYTGLNDHPVRHLFLVDSKELTLSEGEKAYSIRLSKRNGGTSESVNISMDADNPWLYESKDTIMLDLQRLHNAGCDEHVREGDTLNITIVPLNACGDYDENQASNIDITVVGKDQRALAFIVSGCEPNDPTYASKLGGDFFEGVNLRNLCLRTGDNSWNYKEYGVLWGGLLASTTFIPTAVNGYAEFDIFNYEPFDIIILSDYVRTTFSKDDKGNNTPTDAETLASFDKLAQLVDYRPILSLKSHMSKPALTSWRAKGFLADPISLTGKTDMTVLCLGHTILNGVSAKYFNKDDGELKVLTKVGYEGNKGLQGFQSRDLIGFVNIGYVTGDNGEPLIACCERQNVIQARLMVLSINSEATPMLTDGGIEAIRAMLRYLMETDDKKIEDCSNVFDNDEGRGNHNWSDPKNWTYEHLPLLASNVQIMDDCNIDIMNAAAGVLKIENGKTLTINADASLRVAKRFGLRDGNLRINPLPTDDYNIVTIKADANGSGTLIHSASEGWEIPATVEYYSIASGAPDNCNYQWMASPVQNIPQAEVPFAGAWVYGWDKETHTWGNYLRNGDSMTAFDAYCFTQRTGGKNTYTIQGKLVNIQTETTIPLSYNATLSAARQGINVIGNSWTAPINISGWTEADFKNCEASIILFNTGFDPNGTKYKDGSGQYEIIPINTADNLGSPVIPAMQAFQVNATGAGAQLTMNYDRLVRTDHVNRQPMHIQGRRNAESTEGTSNDGITATLRIHIKGERYSDQVYIFRHADCTNGYDNGWDGRKILGAAAALQLFVESEGERYAVSTQPELAGTRLAFFKGEDDTYTMEFDYDGEETLYLYDCNTDRYTPVFTGSTYFFRSETTKLEHRFLLTDNRPEEPSGPTTGIVEVDIEDNSLILSNTTQDPVTLSIFDAAGRLCYRQTLHTPLATIPVPDLPGVYMVEAASRTQHVTRKIIL